MNAFVKAVQAPQQTHTTNGMVALTKTGNTSVDFFFKAGASRGQPSIVNTFNAAYAEDKSIAAKLLFWVRDVRGGAGERDTFRKCLASLCVVDPAFVKTNLHLIPFYGRWDDLEHLVGDSFDRGLEMWGEAIRNGDGLACKWAPRKGTVANKLRNKMNLTPRQYRKMVVNGSSTVEQLMCAGDWSNINFSHVPSVAAARYKKAFNRNAQEAYTKYREALVRGDVGVKVNASAIFPHDVLKDIVQAAMYGLGVSENVTEVARVQWESLPNYMGDKNVLAMVDVSGSMTCAVPGCTGTKVIDVAVALGLYVADKAKGPFKDTFLTFSSTPELLHLKGNIVQKVSQMCRSKWEMSTNLEGAMKLILDVAVDNKVPAEDMPETLVIFSDMMFNRCANDRAIEMVRRMYAEKGYVAPSVIFWNLNAHSSTPVSATENGTALVSGFSPSMMKSIMAGEEFTPYAIMMQTINNDRYSAVKV